LRIGIVDDHPIFRAGLKRLLEREDGLSVEWETSTARELAATIERHPVDVVLMDLQLGSGPGGLDATSSLLAKWPSLKVIVLTGSLDPLARAQAGAAGAAGFLLKDVSASELLSSVRRFANGDATIARPRDDAQLVLSKRERQVLAEVRRGRTNREIAKALGVSTTTVNKHVQQILKKLRVTNRVQAASR
jgi:DNA-binding NarL/FixJ family response regulator